MDLITIDPNDALLRETIGGNESCRAAYAMQLLHYQKAGYEEPWVGYYARKDGMIVGCCAFTGKPNNGRVELAYFTFPENENKGIATEMCRALLAVAVKHDPAVLVTARTLPQSNASTRVLEKNGFRLTGPVSDPEHGEIWEWHYAGGGAIRSTAQSQADGPAPPN